MATITAQAGGNWSDTSTWDLDRIPQDGDDVNLSSYTVVWDASALTIPASGTLNSLTNSSGKLTLALTLGNATLNCTTIQAGAGPLLQPTGTTTNKLTINCSSLIAGSMTNAHAIYSTITNGYMDIYANTISGGSGSNARGLYNYNACTVNIYMGVNGVIKGGSGVGTYGVDNNTSTPCNVYNGTIQATSSASGLYNSYSGTGTYTNVNLIDSTFIAVVGRTPTFVWGPNNFHQTGNYKLFPAGRDRKKRVTYGGR